MDAAGAGADGERHEGGDLLDVVAQRREPERYARRRGGALAAQRGERLEVRHHLRERVDAAYPRVRLRRGGVERHAQLVETGVDEGMGAPASERDDVRVEDDGGTTRLEVRDHRGQLTVEQRLADAVQEHPVQRREAIDHATELRPSQVLLRLASAEGQDARLAERVAATRGLEIERAGQRWAWRQCGGRGHDTSRAARTAVLRNAKPARTLPVTVPETFDRPPARGAWVTATSAMRARRAAALTTISTGQPNPRSRICSRRNSSMRMARNGPRSVSRTP